jgi:hypothetical protein
MENVNMIMRLGVHVMSSLTAGLPPSPIIVGGTMGVTHVDQSSSSPKSWQCIAAVAFILSAYLNLPVKTAGQDDGWELTVACMIMNAADTILFQQET